MSIRSRSSLPASIFEKSRIVLEHLHDGQPQRAAGARQRDELAVAPQRQAVGGAKPYGSPVVLVDGKDPIARQAVGHT